MQLNRSSSNATTFLISARSCLIMALKHLKHLSPILLVISQFISIDCQSFDDCLFSDANGSGRRLDLRALAHTELSKTDSLTPPNTFSFTPCRNALNCDPDTAMALKLETLPEVKCTVLANYDSMQTLPHFDNTSQRWTFQYQTGNDCGQSPWEFMVYFDCDEQSGDFNVISAGYLYIHFLCLFLGDSTIFPFHFGDEQCTERECTILNLCSLSIMY